MVCVPVAPHRRTSLGQCHSLILFEVRRPRKCLEADGYGGDGTEQRGFELCPRREAEGGDSLGNNILWLPSADTFFYSH